MCVCALSGQLESIHLSAPLVAVRNKEVNLTTVLWPNQVGTVTYIWWIGNNTEVFCAQGFSLYLLNILKINRKVLFLCIQVEKVQLF